MHYTFNWDKKEKEWLGMIGGGILGGIPGSHTCNNAKDLLHKHGHWAAVKYNAWVLN